LSIPYLAFILTHIRFPETTKTTLEEIGGLFGDDVAVKIEDADQIVDLVEIQLHDDEKHTTMAHHTERL
jgi:hypothetical protein